MEEVVPVNPLRIGKCLPDKGNGNQSVGFTTRVVLCFMFLKLFFERCEVGNRLFGWGKWLLSYFFIIIKK